MRKIEFRAFKLGTKEFVYGLLSKYDMSHHFNIEGFRVKMETIGQFTGLYDSSGKEIFEGDIVILTEMKFNLQQYEVQYYQGSFILVPYKKTVDDIYEESYHISTFVEDNSEKCKLKIVENIHESQK